MLDGVCRGQRYINEFLRCKCAPDLLALGLFPNGKEITESFALYNAVRQHLWRRFPPNRDETLFSVGDGVTPRAAAIFAFRTDWTCYSFDPKLRMDCPFPCKRLHLVPQRFEHSGVARDITPDIVVLQHAHISVEQVVKSCGAGHYAVVSMPCCTKETFPYPPDVCYRDPSVWSPKNEIQVWRNIYTTVTDGQKLSRKEQNP